MKSRTLQLYFPHFDLDCFQVSPSGIASLHDRACEIFFQLKGGRVDYGAEHARAHGHFRFGRVYERGLYPEWDENHPVHLVAHSYGGCTARVLQQYLADQRFPACFPSASSSSSSSSSNRTNPFIRTSAAWVRSITTISSPLNGSLVVNALGASTKDPTDIQFGSAGWLITSLVHLSEYCGSQRAKQVGGILFLV